MLCMPGKLEALLLKVLMNPWNYTSNNCCSYIIILLKYLFVSLQCSNSGHYSSMDSLILFQDGCCGEIQKCICCELSHHDLLGATMSKILKFSIPQANMNRCLKETKLIQYEKQKYCLKTVVFVSLSHVQSITSSQ